MSHWNYRVIKFVDAQSGEVTYAIHEVHYDDDGAPNGYAGCSLLSNADKQHLAAHELTLTLKLIRTALAIPWLCEDDFKS